MKPCILLTVVFFLSLYTYAQENTAGIVEYEQIVKMDIKLEGQAAQFSHMLPKESKSAKILYFNQDASRFENIEADEEEVVAGQSGANIVIKMQEPENIVFSDLQKKEQLEQREFMTRTFLIEQEMVHNWKITGKQKMILDFPCQQAEMLKDSTKIFAWFTPVIPVSAGPSVYGGLPGLILAVESEDGKNTTIAKNVKFSEPDNESLEKPQKGKKVSLDEFNAIVEEKMKEMGAQRGGEGRQMMIRIHQ